MSYGHPYQERYCQWCNSLFMPEAKNQVFCTRRCKMDSTPSYDGSFEQRLADGSRLLSDDFGELDDDESVTQSK